MCSPSLKTIIEKSRAAEGVVVQEVTRTLLVNISSDTIVYKEVDAVNNNIFEHVSKEVTRNQFLQYVLIYIYTEVKGVSDSLFKHACSRTSINMYYYFFKDFLVLTTLLLQTYCLLPINCFLLLTINNYRRLTIY